MNAEKKTPEEETAAKAKPKAAPKKSAAKKAETKSEKKPAAKKPAAKKAAAKKPAAKKPAATKSAVKKDIYAIIKSGGKQYRVQEDDLIDVELLHAEPGSKVEFNDVLFINDGAPKIGEPSVAGSIVKGEIVAESAGPKVVSIKYRPRQHSQRKFGHRQHYSRVKITEIAVG